MDDLKTLAVVGMGVLFGMSGVVFFVIVGTATLGEWDDVGAPAVAIVAVIVGGAVGGFVAYHLLLRSESKGGHTLTPDAERDARAKFMPSRDQPDKRGKKPGDR